MIHASHARLLVSQDQDRLAIRETDSLWRAARILPSMPLIAVGLLVVFTVLSGAGQAESHGTWQRISKSVFLAFIGTALGAVPMAAGLRIWLIREEIVIGTCGSLAKCQLLGPLRFAKVSIPEVHSGNLHIQTWRGTKTGLHHEIVVGKNPGDSGVRLMSFKSKKEAEEWKERIAAFLSGGCATSLHGE